MIDQSLKKKMSFHHLNFEPQVSEKPAKMGENEECHNTQPINQAECKISRKFIKRSNWSFTHILPEKKKIHKIKIGHNENYKTQITHLTGFPKKRKNRKRKTRN